MHRGNTLGKIEKEIEKLTTHEKLKLVENLANQLRKGKLSTQKELDWTELYGLGKGLWEDDAQEYVNRLREER